VADVRRTRHGHGASIGRYIAGNDLEQRRLTNAVATDEADLMAPRQPGRRAIEQDSALDAVRQIIDMQHGLSR